ncbi:serine hydrolase [Citricoccus nitrophenolicus]|uniref:serine hydrolase n=1 Tax=Citricoccus nitrophenolicus TaxID=863575 RepID=UPI0039B6387F
MSRPLPAVRSMPLAELPAVYPHLRFAVRTADGQRQGHDAGARHPLSGTGKLVLACTVARLAERDAALLGERLRLTDRHRAGARTGTLRLMSGDLVLTLSDAMALVVGTGDAMCVLAVLEFLRDRGHDMESEARSLVAAWGLLDTELSGVEADAGASWGEGLTGWTTPDDLCTLLSALPEPVLAWMGAAFEPAGLASGLPGFGPRTVPHETVAGGELIEGTGGAGVARAVGVAGAAGGEGLRGWASVLVLPGAVVAAFLPADHRESPLQASTALGTAGLSVWQDLAA